MNVILEEAATCQDSDDIDPAFDTNNPDIVADIQWVYLHLADQEATPRNAGARSMLEWARSNPDRFYQMLAAKLSHLAPDVDDYRTTQPEKMDPGRICEIIEGITRQAMERKSGVIVDCPECENRFEPCVGQISDAGN